MLDYLSSKQNEPSLRMRFCLKTELLGPSIFDSDKGMFQVSRALLFLRPVCAIQMPRKASFFLLVCERICCICFSYLWPYRKIF